MARNRFIEHPSQMEPLLPEDRNGILESYAIEVIRHAERLRRILHPVTRAAVVDLVRSMNSYYSNLIEGHRTRPADIDAALRHRFVGSSEQRSLQQMHWAHIETEKWLEKRLTELAAEDICRLEFLSSIHREFYMRLPETLRKSVSERGVTKQVIPGALREDAVTVGIHVPPTAGQLEKFLERFAEFYGPAVNNSPRSIIAAVAAHHRLAWIHPFLDGNGRVTRLFTQAWLHKSDASADGLLTLSRGLARAAIEYKSMLAAADERRISDTDGRGALSERRLSEFCEFTLKVAIDQLAFMDHLLGLDGLRNRIAGYGQRLESELALPRGSAALLPEVFLRGEITRGEVARICSVSPRTAQTVTRTLIERSLLRSDSPKGVLRFAIPTSAAASYFPNLFPAGAD